MRVNGRGPWSLARQLLVLQVVIMIVLVAGGWTLAYLDARSTAQQSAAQQVKTVALSVADSADVRTGFASSNPSRTLQPYAERVRRDTGVDFITIMNSREIRYTHPNPALIGHRFVGDTAPALTQRVFQETYTGTLGPSVRVVVALRHNGMVRGYVAVGITVRAIAVQARERLVPLAVVAVLVLAVGIVGSYLVSARLRRQTKGLGAPQLAAMFGAYSATLHAISDGLLLVDGAGKVLVCNDNARRLLELTEDPVNRNVVDLGLAPTMTRRLLAADTEEELHVTDTHVLAVSSDHAGEFGTAIVLRDHTEVEQLSGELESTRGFAESLRSQAHESANRLHTVVSLIELGRAEDAVRFATEELALAQQLTDHVLGAVSEPVLAAVLLGKSAQANESGVELTVTSDSSLAEGVLGSLPKRDVVTVLGNLIDNAIDAAIAGGGRPVVEVTVRAQEGQLLLRIADTGSGLSAEQRSQVFRRGWSTKASGRGLGLALVAAAVRRNGGSVEVSGSPGAVFEVRLPLGGAG